MSAVHLHVHSHYSFGRATASPEALCSAAARQGIEALALTDLDGLYGLPEFLAAAALHGLHAIAGAALPDPSLPRSCVAGRAVVLARDPQGYAELCGLLTRRHASPHAPLLRLLEGCSEHLWVMSPDLALLGALLRARGPRFLLAELRAGAGWERLAENAAALGVPAVASAAVQLESAADRRFQRLLAAVHRQLPFGRIGPSDLAGERGWMLDEGAMRAAFSRCPEALARAVDVARDCRLDLSQPAAPAGGGATPDAAARLRHRVVESAGRRFGTPLADPLRLRLERELDVLCRGSRAAALLLAADLVAFAWRQGVPLRAAPPAMGSLVAFCLDLHPLDPLRSGLPFPAFCSEPAGGVLRLDLLVADAARPLVVERLRQVLGNDRVALPGRVLRWDLREAVRDVARSAALPAPECERVLRQLPAGWRGEGPDELLARYPRLHGAGMDQAPWDRVLRAASRLAGVPRGLAADRGILAAGGPLHEHVPLQPCAGQITAQWDVTGASAMGLLSLDLPSDPAAEIELRAGVHLSGRAPAGHQAADPPPDGVSVRSSLPDLAPLLSDLRAGRTLGCPGLDSPAVRAALRREPVSCLQSLVQAVAGVPDEAFAERRVRLAGTSAGLGDDEADLLARVLREPQGRGERASVQRSFVSGMQARGHPREQIARAWDGLVAELPAAPSLAETLSAVLGGLRCLDLRRRDPAALLAALLAAPGGGWPLHAHVSEAVRRGVELRRPCVQEGPVESTGCAGVVRVGLGQVRGVRGDLCLEIVTQRDLGGPFRDLGDFLVRIAASDDEVDALVAAGALDSLAGGDGRAGLRRLHRNLRPHRDGPHSGRHGGAGPQVRSGRDPGGDVELLARRAAMLRDEMEALGFTISGHPVEIAALELAGGGQPGAPRLQARPTVGAASSPAGPGIDGRPDGDPADVAGWLVAGQPGQGPVPPDLRWWTVFDAPWGLFDAVIPDRLLRTCGRPPAGPCSLAGVVRRQGGLAWLEVQRIEPLGEGLGYAESA